MSSNYRHLLAAARREHWATRLWWALLALATAILLALLLRHIGIATEYVIAAFLLWTAAWLAPWTAILSLRLRATRPPPAPGATDLAAWKHHARALCSRLDWALQVLRDHDARARVRTAHAALLKAFRAATSPAALEAACSQVTDVTLPDLRRALWLQLIPEIMPLANDAYARADAAPSPAAARAIRLDAMRDATALAVLRLHPHLLMSDLVTAAHQCIFAATAFAAPGDPIIPLAAALAIDWGNPAIPWNPLTARQTTLATILSIDPQASLKYHEPFAPLRIPDDEPRPAPAPAPSPAATPKKTPPSQPPRRRHRSHHHHHHHHHHRSSLRAFLSPIRDISRIFGSFFQRIHYLVKSAFLYR